MSPYDGIRSKPSARSDSAFAPEPLRPLALSTAGVAVPGSCTSANKSPPMPHMCWVVTAKTALAATAASAADPPARSIATPASAARWSTAHTMPFVANRDEKGAGRIRSVCRPADLPAASADLRGGPRAEVHVLAAVGEPEEHHRDPRLVVRALRDEHVALDRHHPHRRDVVLAHGLRELARRPDLCA